MSRVDEAIALAQRGFYVFPVVANSKIPLINDWPNRATRDTDQIRSWFAGTDCNIGIATGKYSDGEALVVVDIDNKGSKHGDARVLELEMQGMELPASFEQSSPTGGRHIVYVTPRACKQGTDVLGAGLDIRSRGGYIVGPGSTIDGKQYQQINGHSVMVQAPNWLVEKLGSATIKPADRTPIAGVDAGRANLRAIQYLIGAPAALEGEGGDAATFRVAARCKDFGCTEAETVLLLLEHWNDRCDPPWADDELAAKVAHAFKYGKEPPGVAAPEAVFPPVVDEFHADHQHPIAELNKNYAFVFAGGHANVLWETTDAQGQFAFHLMNKNAFQDMLAARKFVVGNRTIPLTQAWLESPLRRTYDGIVFEPGIDAGSRWYNMWRGFVCEPAAHGEHPMVERWKEHLLENVCRGDQELATWLTSWFAHLIQKPFEKILVAVVFKGSKGVGKNACIERICKLLGTHALVTSRRRYLVSNFTLHLQKSLLFVLDEAFWSGDKEAEGVVKDLITGSTHIIEPKGKESYTVRNLTRVAVIGNEDWLVPASVDERRWAVFTVGDKRKQDKKYFEEMRIGLDDQGGNAHLLRYLLDYNITIDLNQAPQTQGLIEQKHASLEPAQQWWLDCLMQGDIVGGDFAGEWPEKIPTNRMRDSFERAAKKRQIRSRLPEERGFGRILKEIAPRLERRKARPEHANDKSYAYESPGLEILREDWEKYIGGKVVWPE